MGVLSLHNECPPLDYGPASEAICHGLVLGEEGTSALLHALADCMNALAAMDDTVGNIVNAFGSAARQANGKSNGSNGSYEDPGISYARFFETLAETGTRIDGAIVKYRAWADYAKGALNEGRGSEFKLALERASGDDFGHLVARRIELLRKLSVRIKVVKEFRETGSRMFMSYDYPGFFTLFMAPVRDMAIAVNELYSEVVRGALASHQAFFQVCLLMGEDKGAEVRFPADDRFQIPNVLTRSGADQTAGSAIPLQAADAKSSPCC